MSAWTRFRNKVFGHKAHNVIPEKASPVAAVRDVKKELSDLEDAYKAPPELGDEYTPQYSTRSMLEQLMNQARASSYFRGGGSQSEFAVSRAMQEAADRDKNAWVDRSLANRNEWMRRALGEVPGALNQQQAYNNRIAAEQSTPASKGWFGTLAPIVGNIAGSIVGGPIGGMIGSGLGSGLGAITDRSGLQPQGVDSNFTSALGSVLGKSGLRGDEGIPMGYSDSYNPDQSGYGSSIYR